MEGAESARRSRADESGRPCGGASAWPIELGQAGRGLSVVADPTRHAHHDGETAPSRAGRSRLAGRRIPPVSRPGPWRHRQNRNGARGVRTTQPPGRPCNESAPACERSASASSAWIWKDIDPGAGLSELGLRQEDMVTTTFCLWGSVSGRELMCQPELVRGFRKRVERFVGQASMIRVGQDSAGRLFRRPSGQGRSSECGFLESPFAVHGRFHEWHRL